MTNIPTILIVLTITVIVIKLLKAAYINRTSRPSIRYESIVRQVNNIIPSAKVVKVLNAGECIELLCLDEQGSWFKVLEENKKNIQFSAININEVVTALTKIK